MNAVVGENCIRLGIGQSKFIHASVSGNVFKRVAYSLIDNPKDMTISINSIKKTLFSQHSSDGNVNKPSCMTLSEVQNAFYAYNDINHSIFLSIHDIYVKLLIY
jgi:hypothetical protein